MDLPYYNYGPGVNISLTNIMLTHHACYGFLRLEICHSSLKMLLVIRKQIFYANTSKEETWSINKILFAIVCTSIHHFNHWRYEGLSINDVLVNCLSPPSPPSHSVTLKTVFIDKNVPSHLHFSFHFVVISLGFQSPIHHFILLSHISLPPPSLPLTADVVYGCPLLLFVTDKNNPN